MDERALICGVPDDQAVLCRRRHHPSSPPPARSSPGRPAPAMGAGTGSNTLTVAIGLTACSSSVEIPNVYEMVALTADCPKFASVSPVPGGVAKVVVAMQD